MARSLKHRKSVVVGSGEPPRTAPPKPASRQQQTPEAEKADADDEMVMSPPTAIEFKRFVTDSIRDFDILATGLDPLPGGVLRIFGSKTPRARERSDRTLLRDALWSQLRDRPEWHEQDQGWGLPTYALPMTCRLVTIPVMESSVVSTDLLVLTTAPRPDEERGLVPGRGAPPVKPPPKPSGK
jgi:hypothetical protein